MRLRLAVRSPEDRNLRWEGDGSIAVQQSPPQRQQFPRAAASGSGKAGQLQEEPLVSPIGQATRNTRRSPASPRAHALMGRRG